MAARKKKTNSKNGAQTTALANWEEELAKQAEAAAEQEASTGGGQFFSLRGGTLSLNDAPLPNNEVAVVIVDSILENAYYDSDYDPDNPSGPTCYAFGRDEDEMGPDPANVEKPQSELCSECPMNEWGSADRGRGKACRNRRRLALVPAGDFDRDGGFEPYEDPEHFLKAEVAYLALPPTSLNSFGSYVKQLAGALRRPPHAVFTRVAVVQDAKSQFKVTFENLGLVPNELIPPLMQRNEEVKSLIEFPYPKQEAKPTKPARGGSKKASKKTAKKTTTKKASGAKRGARKF